jgi:hypothetical protein
MPGCEHPIEPIERMQRHGSAGQRGMFGGRCGVNRAPQIGVVRLLRPTLLTLNRVEQVEQWSKIETFGAVERSTFAPPYCKMI